MDAPPVNNLSPVCVEDLPKSRRPGKAEWVLAGLLFLNAIIGLVLGTAISLPSGRFDQVAVLLPVLGLAAGGLMLRWPVLGLFLGQLFYLPQVLHYSTPESNWSIQCGLSASFYLEWRDAAKVGINVLAIALLVAHFALLNLRGRKTRAGRLPGCVN